MAQFKYYLEKRKDKNGEYKTKNAPIIYSFSWEGYRLKSTVGERTDTKYWDEEKQKLKGGRERVQINQRLDAFKAKVEKIYREAVIMEEVLTPDLLKKKLSGKKNSGRKLLDFFQEFIDTSKATCSLNTIKKYDTTKKHLEDYFFKKRRAYQFDDFTPDTLQEIVDFLINDEDKGLTNNTVAKYIKVIKRFLNWSNDKGYNTSIKHKGFTFSEKEGEIIVLNWDELMHLYNLKIEKEHLQHIRDIFCFGCFTGLRFSDIQNLKWGQVGKDSIKVNTIKTNDSLNIPLIDYSKAILEKYKGMELENNRCLPTISNQKTNFYLKEVGKLAKFTEPITTVKYKGTKRIESTLPKHKHLTTHIARKTFITNAFRLKIPTELIMMVSGHKDHRVFKRYNKIAQEQLNEAMNRFNIQ